MTYLMSLKASPEAWNTAISILSAYNYSIFFIIWQYLQAFNLSEAYAPKKLQRIYSATSSVLPYLRCFSVIYSSTTHSSFGKSLLRRKILACLTELNLRANSLLRTLILVEHT